MAFEYVLKGVMEMEYKGKIVDFSVKAGGGIVSVEDKTYVFHVHTWQHTFPPLRGLPVVFEVGSNGLVKALHASKYHYWYLRICRFLLKRPAVVYSNSSV